jgi:hypothetical protein
MQNLPKIVITSARVFSLLTLMITLFTTYFSVYYLGVLDTYFLVTDTSILATFIVIIILLTLLNILFTFIDNLFQFDSFANFLNLGLIFALFIILINESFDLYSFLMENLNSNYYLSTSLLPFILILFVFVLQIISAVYSVKELKNQFGVNEKSTGNNLNRNTTKKLQVDPYERLNKLKELLDSNTITDDEFQIEKAKILRSI